MGLGLGGRCGRCGRWAWAQVAEREGGRAAVIQEGGLCSVSGVRSTVAVRAWGRGAEHAVITARVWREHAGRANPLAAQQWNGRRQLP